MGALTLGALGTTLLINGGIAIVILTTFNMLRTLRLTKSFYAPKRYLFVPFRFRPPKLSASFFTWWTALGKFSEDDILACAGQDALTYLNFLKLGLKMSAFVGLFCIFVILPINAAAGGNIKCTTDATGKKVCATPDSSNFTYLDFTTMANIKNKSSLLWVHLVGVYVVSAIVLKMLWKFQAHAVKLRVKYLASTRGGGEAHTVLVQNIPGSQAGTVNQRIYENMDTTLGKCIPGSVKQRVRSTIEGSGSGRKGLKLPFGSAGRSSNKAPETYDVYLTGKLDDAHPHNAEGFPRGERQGDSARASAAGDGSPDHFPVSQRSPVGGHAPGPHGHVHHRHHHRLDDDPQDPDVLAARAPNVLDGPDGHHAHHTAAGGDVAVVMPGADRQVPRGGSRVEDVRRYYMDLRNRDGSMDPKTDFHTWQQAEAALKSGVPFERLVWKEFARTYSEDAIEAVTVIKDVSDVEGLMAKYDGVKVKLEDMLDNWTNRMRAGKPVKLKSTSINPSKLGESAVQRWGADKVKVEKSEYLEWQLSDLFRQVTDAQRIAQAKDTSSAFVTFKSRMTQVQAASSLHYHDKTYWTVEAASGPQEVLWGNVGMRGWERTIRFILAWSLFILMTAFYTIPVVAIQGFLQIKYLDDIPGSSVFLNNVWLRSLINSVLPGLALTIFLALVPTIIKMLNKLQGMYSEASVDFEIGRKYYIFLYLQVFVIFIVGGSLISNFSKIADDSSSYVRGLGQTIPTQASFYISYTLVSALISQPMKLLQPAPLVLYAIKATIAGSARARRRLWARQYYSYGGDLPDHTLTVLFGLVFCIMHPIIALPCVIYFAVASFVARYQLLYVCREAYQSGGRFQMIIYNQIFVALMTFQIAMFAVLSVKGFPFAPLLLLPICISLVYNALAAKTFKQPLANLSTHAAADLDRADQAGATGVAASEAEMMRCMDCEDTPLGPAGELYKPSCLKLSGDTHAALLRELSTTRRIVADVASGSPVPQEILDGGALEDDDDHEDNVLKDTFKDVKGAVTAGKKSKKVQNQGPQSAV